MNGPIALIVDDEPDIRELLEITLSRMGVGSFCAESLAQAHQALEIQKFDLCLADMRLPDGDGLDLVKHINTHHPALPVAQARPRRRGRRRPSERHRPRPRWKPTGAKESQG